MRKALPLGRLARIVLGLLAFAGLLGGYAYWSLVPHLGRATLGEILAAVPPDLLASEARDLNAEARFVRLSRLLREGFEKEDAEQARTAMLAATGRSVPYHLPTRAELADYDRRCGVLALRVKALLAEGPIQAPPRTAGAFSIKNWQRALPDRKVALAAAKRGDHAACLEDALWRLRLTQTAERAGESVESFVESPSTGSTYETIREVESQGGYSPEGRAILLEALRPKAGRKLALGNRVRRYFREVLLPKVVRIGAGADYWSVVDPKQVPELRAGSFDPVETARLMAERVLATLDDLDQPPKRQERTREFYTNIHERFLDFPPKLSGLWSFEDRWQNLEWRVAMNRLPNSLGLSWASSLSLLPNDEFGATELSLLRAILLLHAGRTDLPPDPYGAGPIRFDPKRRLVWSVDPNRRDEDGLQANSGGAGDIAYRY